MIVVELISGGDLRQYFNVLMISIKWTAPEVNTLLMLCINYIANCITIGLTFQTILHC